MSSTERDSRWFVTHELLLFVIESFVGRLSLRESALMERSFAERKAAIIAVEPPRRVL